MNPENRSTNLFVTERNILLLTRPTYNIRNENTTGIELNALLSLHPHSCYLVSKTEEKERANKRPIELSEKLWPEDKI